MNEQPNELSNGPSENSPQALFVTLILDESGSMQSCKRAAITGFNQYVKSLKDEPAATWFTLTLFNSHRTEVHYRGVPVSTVPELDVETYRPQDTTPLYDAIGQTLSAARQEAPAGLKKLCVILTDGLENASKEYTRKQIFTPYQGMREGRLAVRLSRSGSRRLGGGRGFRHRIGMPSGVLEERHRPNIQ